MDKKVLSEIAIFYGDIAMPKGFEIDRNKLQEDILKSQINNEKFPYSREWDKLNTYLREHIQDKYNFQLINKLTSSYLFKPNVVSIPQSDIDLMDLKNAPDFTMLYGVNVDKCKIIFYYDDNRRKGNLWKIDLDQNFFVMLPSTQLYYITNNQKNSLNSILKITYEFK
jgi:hypothetical protein|tara:strand:- start:269 stop:772 length:504 start_codon:yes stop_codon:yes gene_type:complete